MNHQHEISHDSKRCYKLQRTMIELPLVAIWAIIWKMYVSMINVIETMLLHKTMFCHMFFNGLPFD